MDTITEWTPLQTVPRRHHKQYTMLAESSNLKYLLLLAVCFTSWQITMETSCNEACIYIHDDIDEADCYEQGLTELPTSGCENAVTLQAGLNNIAEINQDTFTGFNRLRSLFIGSSNVKRIMAGAFQPIASTLQDIDLSNNRLLELENDTFASIYQLKQIDLRWNLITQISSQAFNDLPSLTILFLSDNDISNLFPSVFDGLPNLRNLRIESNRLSEVDSRLFLNLNNLTHLTLANNSIEYLTGETLTSSSLKSINISQNILSFFDCDWIVQMTALTTVDLSHNSIQYILNWQPSQLNILSLDHNPFDCSCQTKDLAGHYQDNSLLAAPTCYNPPSKRNMSLREINFEDCYSTKSTTVMPAITRSSSVIALTKPSPDIDSLSTAAGTKPHEKETTSKMELIFASQGAAVAGTFQFASKDILYPVMLGIVALLVIAIILFVTLFRHTKKKQPPQSTRESGQNIPPSSRGNSPSQQSRGSIRHIYQEIPDGETTRQVDQNFNVLLPQEAQSCRCCHEQQFDVQRSLHPSAYHLSDSQDSGLADQWRNSVSDWLQNNVQYISVTNTSSTHSQVEMSIIHPQPPQDSQQPPRDSMHPPCHSQLTQLPQYSQSQRSQPAQQRSQQHPEAPKHLQITKPIQHSQQAQYPQSIARTTTPHTIHPAATTEKRAHQRRCSSCSCHRNRSRESKQPAVSPQSEPLLLSSPDHRTNPDIPSTSGYVPHRCIN